MRSDAQVFPPDSPRVAGQNEASIEKIGDGGFNQPSFVPRQVVSRGGLAVVALCGPRGQLHCHRSENATLIPRHARKGGKSGVKKGGK